MSTFKQALMAQLTGAAAITAITGADNVWTFPAPQEASLPYILVSRTSGVDYKNLAASTDQYEEFWQVSCFAATDLVAENLKEEVITIFNTVTAASWSPDSGVTNYTVHNTYLEDTGPDIEEAELDGSQATSYHKPLSFRILRSRTAS